MKKLLSLILTLALLSTMFVFGATSASAAVATQTGETSYAAEGYVHVTEKVSAGTQTVYYNVEDTADSNSYDTLNNLSTSTKYWSLLKFNVGNYSEIEKITLKLSAERNSYTRVRVYALTKADYEAAIADTVDGKKTLSGESLLTAPAANSHIAQSGYVAETGGDTAHQDLTITLTSTSIKQDALDDGYVYLALGAGYTASSGEDGAKTATIRTPFYSDAEAHPALKITGTKVIEGLGTKIMVEKTKDVYLNDEIAHLSSDGAKATTKSSSRYINYASAAIDGLSADAYPFYQYYYLKGDISELKGKEIISATLSVRGKKYKTAPKVRAHKTSSDWTAETITYASSPALDEAAGYEELNYSSTEKYTTADVTSFINNTEDAISIRLSLYHNGNSSNNHKQGATVRYAGYGSDYDSPKITITYIDELDTTTETLSAGTTFKFQAETTATGLPVMLLVAIYDSTGSIIGVEASPVLTVGTDDLVEEVDLANYEGAASVQCFFWNGTTLEPYMEVTGANVA